MKNMNLDKVSKEYILDCISSDGYEDDNGEQITLKDSKEALAFLYKTFKSEYGFNIARYGERVAFKEWIQGLPSCFHIAFENFRILELSKSWGSFDGFTGKALERREDMILEKWFSFIANKTFQLFRKHKVYA